MTDGSTLQASKAAAADVAARATALASVVRNSSAGAPHQQPSLLTAAAGIVRDAAAVLDGSLAVASRGGAGLDGVRGLRVGLLPPIAALLVAVGDSAEGGLFHGCCIVISSGLSNAASAAGATGLAVLQAEATPDAERTQRNKALSDALAELTAGLSNL